MADTVPIDVSPEGANSAVVRPHLAVHPLETTLGHLLRRTQQVHTALWTGEFHKALTGPQYALLCVLAARAEVDQRGAGNAASLDKSTTADIVSRLIRGGWIDREPDGNDRRRKLLRLTTHAAKTMPELTRRAAFVQRRLLEPLSPGQVRRFVKLLRLVAYQGEPPVEPTSQPLAPVLGADVLALGTTPGHLLRRAEQVHGAAWAAHVGTQITAPQYAIISALTWRPTIVQNVAGELASLDRSSTADIVARLQQRGWVLSTPDRRDARRKVLSLHEDAFAALEGIVDAVAAVQRELAAPLDPHEQDELVMLFRRVAYR